MRLSKSAVPLVGIGPWVLLVPVLMSAGAGCATGPRTPATTRPDLPPRIAMAIEEGRVVVGMTPDQVRLAWGEPAEADVSAPDRHGRVTVHAFRYRVETTDGRGGGLRVVFNEREVRFADNRVVRLLERIP